MKKKLLKIILLFITIISFTACSDDDKMNEIKNEMIIGGNTLPIEIARIQEYNFSFKNGNYSMDLILGSSGITIDEYGDYEGTGTFFELSFATSKRDEIVTGTYKITDANNPVELLEISGCAEILKGNNFVSEDDACFKVGTIDIALENGIYTISSNGLLDNNDRPVTINYKGSLEIKEIIFK